MEYLEQILKNVPEGIMVYDNQLIFQIWNRGMKKISGFDETEVVGKDAFEVFPNLKKTGFDKLMLSALKGETIKIKSIQYEHRITLQKKWAKVMLFPLYNKDKHITGVIAFVSDITYLKRLEEQLVKKENELIIQNEEFASLTDELKERNEDCYNINERLQEANEKLIQINLELQKAKDKAEESDRLKTSFFQNMSHEIRTPMNAIVGFAQLLENNIEHTDLNKEYAKLNKEYAKLIIQQSFELLDVIDEILEISGIETGHVKLSRDECHLHELLSYLYGYFERFKNRRGKDNILLMLNNNQHFNEQIVLTDKFKLRQIFMHLLHNAFKFTNAGIIEFGFHEANNEHITFYVKDTGCGIADDQLEKVFEKFIRFSPKNYSRDGMGIGLSIVKGLVTLLGGSIWLTSELNRGTTFYFSIKRDLPEVTKDQHKVLDFIVNA